VRTTSDLCGRVLDARYRVERVVATGGMGTVYEAFDQRLERVVAVKVMNENLVYEPGFMERFSTEARAAARLSDPHVVAVFDRGHAADAVYLVMEYVPGRTLRKELAFGGRLPVARALDILSAVLKGLSAAHAAGFVHGDIKPENVLIGDRGAIKVTDFGLARAIDAGDPRTSPLLGTAAYLAPEQASNRIPDPRSDLYSCGILAFEMLTGHVPFRADSPDDVLALHQTQRVPDPSAFVEVSAGFDELCARATAKDPGDRFQTAREMLEAVSQLRRQADRHAPAPAIRDGAPAVAVPVAAVVPQTMVVGEAPLSQTTVVPAAPEPEAAVVVEPEVSAAEPVVAVVGPPRTTPPPVKRRRGRRAFVLLVLAALAASVGYIAWQLGTTETVDAPRLVGMTRSEALSALDDLGLRMRVSEEKYSEKRESGTIIRSDPRPGEKVAVNGTVSVVMSKGPERYRVPDVRGMSQSGASQALEAVNLTAGTILQGYSRKIDEGQVMRSNPKIGTPLKPGTAVSLTISQGPEPVVVPDVRGMTLEQAQAALTATGLRPRTVEQFDESVEFGRVISTNPGDASPAFRGDRVQVVVSKGSQFVPVPSVVGMTTDEATQTLQDAGFDVTTREQFGVTVANRVISQDPSGGSAALRGTLVTLTIT
jgi:serine/threonine-protein kinase